MNILCHILLHIISISSIIYYQTESHSFTYMSHIFCLHMLTQVSAVVSIPLWQWFLQRFGKKTAAFCGITVSRLFLFGFTTADLKLTLRLQFNVYAILWAKLGIQHHCLESNTLVKMFYGVFQLFAFI